MTRWDAALVVFGVLACGFVLALVLVLGLCKAASDADERVQRALERERRDQRLAELGAMPKTASVITADAEFPKHPEMVDLELVRALRKQRTTPWTSDHR